MEVVNRSLSTVLRAVMKGSHRSWDEFVPILSLHTIGSSTRLLIFLHLKLYMGLILLLLWICCPFLIHIPLCIRKELQKLNLLRKCMTGLKNKYNNK